jgi:mono/diheme cytochrome c family protein
MAQQPNPQPNPTGNPVKVSVTVGEVLAQVKRDLFDKEVASAATYSYLWIADQMGHIGLGLVIVFVLSWIFGCCGLAYPQHYLPLILASVIFAIWEYNAYVTYAAMAKGMFPSDKLLLARNAIVAAAYMILGAVAGFSWQSGSIPKAALTTLVAALVCVLLAWPWLRQKIVWQKAGLPFLFRLSNASPTITPASANALEKLITAQIAESKEDKTALPEGPVVILSGPLHAGKTSLACGIGTELAFGDVKVRYTTFDKLVQMADQDDLGPENINYWPWRDGEALIVDDVDVGTVAKPPVDAEDFVKVLSQDLGDARKLVGRRMTVWVLGDKTGAELAHWTQCIKTICAEGQGHEPQVLNLEFQMAQVKESFRQQAKPAAVITPAMIAQTKAVAGWALVALSTLLFAVSLLWLAAERRWDSPADLSEADAFRYGTLGLEIAPYKLVAVLDHVSGDAFVRHPIGGGPPMHNGTWWKDFGFNPGGPATPSKKCPLPLGFTLSNLLPLSATPVPVKFAGLSCAACHSQQVRVSDSETHVVIGAGTASADVIAFGDALKQAVARKDVTADSIQAAYAKYCDDDKSEGLWYRVAGKTIENLLINQWLSQFRGTTLSDASKYDLPFHGTALVGDIGAGPGRTRPFRSVVRNNLDFPGATNLAYSKVPAAFEQSRDLRPQSQYDGSIVDTVTRSLIAAYTSGASPAALNRAPVAHNVWAAANYTLKLGPLNDVPTFAKTFPGVPAPDAATLARGEKVYMAGCASCHGHRPAPDAAWDVTTGATAIHRIAPLAEIGTDPQRVVFRYADILPLSLWLAFPDPPAPQKPRPRCAIPDAGGPFDQSLDGQRKGFDYLEDIAIKSGDNVLYQYWQTRRAAFEEARREFPAGHKLAFGPDEICYNADHLGYYNSPIPAPYLRAPYLHNASVPTMRQLVNLDDRPKQFCRGNNLYDPLAMGLKTDTPAPGAYCGGQTPFLFDTTLPGNSNAGHDYPWSRDQVKANPQYQADLEALIAYLRTQ